MIVALFIAAAVSVASGQTSTGSTFEREIQIERQALTQDISDEAIQDKEKVMQRSVDFFPITGSGTFNNPDDTYGSFVMFQWNGIPYDLQDVPRQVWFAPYVRDMATKGIVSGYMDSFGRPSGVFGPDRPVSIEELAKMALVAAGTDTTVCPKSAVNPLAAQTWSTRFIACAEQQKMTVFSDGTVDLKRPALRGEVIATILEAFHVALDPPAASGSLVFKDVQPSTQFASAIDKAGKDGIVIGYSDTSGVHTGMFGTDRQVNRAEIAKMIDLALQLYGTKK
jgi:hypothetical protein